MDILAQLVNVGKITDLKLVNSNCKSVRNACSNMKRHLFQIKRQEDGNNKRKKPCRELCMKHCLSSYETTDVCRGRSQLRCCWSRSESKLESELESESIFFRSESESESPTFDRLRSTYVFIIVGGSLWMFFRSFQGTPQKMFGIREKLFW